MMTFLDLLIIVSLVLMAGSLLSVALMFLVRNPKVQRVCFGLASALSLYVGYVGLRINWPDFFGQAVVAAAMMLVSIAAVVLALVRKGDEKAFLAARIAAAAALAVGAANALLI